MLVVTPGGKEATIVALNKNTGAVIWKSAVPGGDAAAYASAIVVEAAGRKQYVQFLGAGVVGVDAKTGQFLWRYDADEQGPGQYRDARGAGRIRLQHEFAAVRRRPGAVARDSRRHIGGAGLLRARPAQYAWRTGSHRQVYLRHQSQGPCPAEFATGKIQWQNDGLGPGSVLYAEGRLYFHGENGEVELVEATHEAYRQKGHFTLPAQPKHASAGGGTRDEHSWAYPVVANGRMYIRDLGSLWCYDIRDPKAR